MSFGGGAPAAAAPAAAAPEPVKEKDSFNIKLGAVDQKAKIKIIKEVRTITGLGLKEVSNHRKLRSFLHIIDTSHLFIGKGFSGKGTCSD